MDKSEWQPAVWIDNTWTLPLVARERLAVIYPPDYIPAVEQACRHYLAFKENEEARPRVPEDGKIILEIAQTAEKLARLLVSSENLSACERLEEHIDSQWEKGMPTRGIWIADFRELIDELHYFADASMRCPAAKNLGKRGRTKGCIKDADRVLAFELWDIYKRAHGQPPKRSEETMSGGKDRGPMARTMEILAPLLNLKTGLPGIFRIIERNHKELGHSDKK